jgi:hypothetical protein
MMRKGVQPSAPQVISAPWVAGGSNPVGGGRDFNAMRGTKPFSPADEAGLKHTDALIRVG